MLITHQLISNNRQLGVSLIESMISLLVISVGLLGIAALQVTSMKQNNSAMHHSQAVWIGYDIADRIRANATQFDAYDGTNTDTTYSHNCLTGPCSAAELVIADQADWSSAVQNLPSGSGMISINADELLIKVMWDDEGTGAVRDQCGPDPKIDLTCYTVTMAR